MICFAMMLAVNCSSKGEKFPAVDREGDVHCTGQVFVRVYYLCTHGSLVAEVVVAGSLLLRQLEKKAIKYHVHRRYR
jgi:hypothetical protein